ncbi:MAG TPA: L-threonylcarbamoyladenylate synthase [Gaiellaceae bacterium]|nr:L-threonylcarbamoyladenylate synthase [Gaiellaceae bacterium]
MDELIEALRAGRPALFPTDTVYGLVSLPTEAAVAALYTLKGRRPEQPTALLAASPDQLVAAIPELDPARLVRGPYTLVVPNPGRRYAWLAGARPDAIGVRLPDLSPAATAVLEAVGCVAATSANEPGGPDPLTLDDVPLRLREACPALDEGPLRGVPSTVVDLTGGEPRILREGAVPAAEAIARLQYDLRHGDRAADVR